jgi:hypothetical protein
MPFCKAPSVLPENKRQLSGFDLITVNSSTGRLLQMISTQ